MKSNVILTVLRKELKDIFRDKKTLFVSVLLPLIIFPVMFGVIGRSVDKTSSDVKNNFKISIQDSGNSSLGKFIKQQQSVKLVSSNDLNGDVKDGKILAGIYIPESFDTDVTTEKNSEVNIIYDNSSQQSEMAVTTLKSYIDAYSKSVISERLSKRGIETKILNPVGIMEKTTEKASNGTAKLMLSLMLPLLLVIYCVTGPMAAAVDLGAGEKERGTLEPLLTTQASRMSLLWGKFLAITIMGFITTMASLAGLIISMQQKNGIFNGMAGIGLDYKALILIGIVAVLTTMAFGALELSISIFARSFKEAQTYITPLTVISIIPIYATYMLDAKNIDLFYFNIPLANVTCTIKELVSGIFNPVHMIITFVWCIVYILISVVLARFMFNREEVVFRA